MRIHVAKAMAAACLLSSPAAFAADLIAPPVEVPTWTGFYVGVHGGVAGGDFDYPWSYSDYDCCHGERNDDPDVFSGAFGLNGSGVFGGISAGGDYQFENSNFLIGVVGDISFTDYEGKLSFEIEDVKIEAGSELEWFATLRGRVGFVWEDFLFYGTGGVAFGEVKSLISGFGEELSTKNDHVGWTVGVGGEYKITENVTFKAEYLYIDLGEEELVNTGDEYCDIITLDVGADMHTLKAGFNFRF